MYGLPQDLKPGMTLEDMFKLRATAGSCQHRSGIQATNENYVAHVLNKVECRQKVRRYNDAS